MKHASSAVAVLGAALFLLVAPACGDSADADACDGKEEGEACTDSEGQDGVCSLDGSDTLECEDTVNE